MSRSSSWWLPPGAHPDAGIILAARGIRAFTDGYVALLLPYYLTLLGYSAFQVGAIATANGAIAAAPGAPSSPSAARSKGVSRSGARLVYFQSSSRGPGRPRAAKRAMAARRSAPSQAGPVPGRWPPKAMTRSVPELAAGMRSGMARTR